LDTQRFNACLDSGKYAQKVQADYQEGLQKGVNGTPATFVNGQLVSGALPYESFKQIIDSILK
jgi:protein-disulfide isomerase